MSGFIGPSAAGGGGGKTLFIENPATGDIDPSFYTPTGFTLTEMRAIIRGGTLPSIGWTIRFAADRSAVGTEVVTGGTTSTNTTTGDAVTVFNAGVVPAGSFVWIVLGVVTVGVDQPITFAVTLS